MYKSLLDIYSIYIYISFYWLNWFISKSFPRISYSLFCSTLSRPWRQPKTFDHASQRPSCWGWDRQSQASQTCFQHIFVVFQPWKYIFQTLQTYSKTASYHYWCICLIVFGYLFAWAWWIASELGVSKDGFPAANPAATPTNATTIYCYSSSSSYYPHTHQRTCVHLFLVMAFNFNIF